MPIASPEAYLEMLDRAKAGAFAYPAINVTSSQTLNAAIRGFAEAQSDGIIQVSTGGAEYLSGPTVKNMVTGRVARGETPLFQSHMWDGSAVPLDENLRIAEELLAEAAAAHIVLEIEVGVV